MLFSQVAQVFDHISTLSGRTEITKSLALLFGKASPKEAQIISYISLGLLRAPYHGTQFALAEKSMIRIVADASGSEVDFIQKRMTVLGDLALVCAEQKKESIDEHFTVQEVYDQLCLLEKISGTGSYDQRSVLLQNLFKKLSSISCSFIVRIVLGKLRLGFSDMTLLDALSWSLFGDKSLHSSLEHAYNICADIGLIAYTLKKDGPEGIALFKIHIGIPVRPAAAERASSAEQVITRLGRCAAQPKIDGFRLQIHKSGNNITCFSRNLLDMTALFPEIEDYLRSLPADRYIIEGEAVAYDQATGICMPFQQTITRKRKHAVATAAEELPLTFIIFDILYAEDKSLLTVSHEKRREKLIELFGEPQDTLVTVIPEKIVTTAEQLKHYFDAMLLGGFEGLVLKKLDSLYQAGKRNFNWIKFKRQEGTRISDSIDAVILGYYAGKGRRTSLGMGAFLIGAYDSESDSYKTIAKVGTGLSDDEWRMLKKQCDMHSSYAQPSQVICPLSLIPSVWTEPVLVCEIQADEITLSPLHAAGYALRFPRFIKIRTDKSPQDATTVSELASLYKLGLKQ